jgi:hypothetical protein
MRISLVVLGSSAVVERECDVRATSMRASKKSPRTISKKYEPFSPKAPYFILGGCFVAWSLSKWPNNSPRRMKHRS